ncbi:MAG: hypothetical protein H6810_09610 [Phycisphaeraceae bacterium]|nr:MAG: hypothetical protein H6810_09610 [Phycisphaeraceae bacterium]
MRRPEHNTGGVGRAFTLIEVIVAVGILALVGVVAGTIFATVGDTVTQGRRVSNMNRFAARVERVMRRDFENMVRENGFLVIRNEVTSDYGGRPQKVDVGLTATDQSPRPRRIDEIMFFSRGDFTSRRTPLSRDMAAHSNVARIYYGHGQKMPVDYGSNPGAPDYETRYARPRLDDPNNFTAARLGQPSQVGATNPNEYASDWSLLRQVTLLSPRKEGLQDLPDNVFGLEPNGNTWQDYYRVADSSRQVALGPAAQSVFRSVAFMQPYELNTRADAGGNFTRLNPSGFSIRPLSGGSMALLPGGDETVARPLFTSGIVDVAVTDLEEIRQTVTATWFGNLNAPREAYPTSFMPYDFSGTIDRLNQYERMRRAFNKQGEARVGTAIVRTGPTAQGSLNQAQQMWMLDALPSTPFDPAEPRDTGFRVRYEDNPPRLALDDGTVTPDADARLKRAVEEADQGMLGASEFLPRCTEFIVEFSLGIIDRRNPLNNPNYGQPIWFGLRRFRDGGAAPNGRYDEGGNNAVTADTLFADALGTSYDGAVLADELDPTGPDNRFNIRGALGDSVFEDGNLPRNGTDDSRIDAEMIGLMRCDQRVPPALFSDAEDATAAEYCFGYTYRDDNGTPNDTTDDTTRAWPWPKLIRITMRFVDPSDPDTERTYEAVFSVPSRDGTM